jgi:hypothetical protein
MYCQVYLRKGIVYVPTMGVMEKGFYRGIEPVAVVSAANTEALNQALLTTIGRGSPSVPMLKRRDWPPPVLLKHAGVKTWSAFESGASLWSVKRENGQYQIFGYKRHPTGRGSARDPDQTIIFPLGSTVDEVVERMTAILQNAAKR